MKIKSISKLMSLSLSVIMAMGIVSFVSFGDLFATEDLLMVDQSVIDANNGALPVPENGQDLSIRENITVTRGMTTDTGMYIYFNGYRILYANYDPTEYMITSNGGFIGFYGESDRKGLLESKGAPILSMHGDCSSNNWYVDFYGSINSTELSDLEPAFYADTDENTSLAFNQCTIRNFAGSLGGAVCIMSEDSSLYLGNTEISNCLAIQGAAVYSNSKVTVTESSMKENYSLSNGSAVYIGGYGSLEIDQVTITDNHCYYGDPGGAVYIDRLPGNDEHNDDYGLKILDGVYNRIEGNTDYVSRKECNVVLAGSCSNNAIDIDEEFYDFEVGVNIGVTADPSRTVPVFVNSKYREWGTLGFFCDDPDMYFLFKDNGVYIAEKSTENVARIEGYQLLIYGGEIGVRCYFRFKDGLDPEDYYVVASCDKFNTNEEIFAVDPSKSNIETEDPNLMPGYCYFDIPVDSAYMTSNIMFAIRHVGNTTSTTIFEDIFTVQDYAKAILKNPSKYSDAEVTLVKALLNYGAASQTYFNVNTNKLANSCLSEEDKVINFTQSDYDYIQNVGEPGNPKYYNGKKISYYGMTVPMKSSPYIKLYFKIEGDVDIEDITATTSSGEQLSIYKNVNPSYFSVNIPNEYGFYYPYWCSTVRIICPDDFGGSTSDKWQLEVDRSIYNYMYLYFINGDETEDPALTDLLKSFCVLSRELRSLYF